MIFENKTNKKLPDPLKKELLELIDDNIHGSSIILEKTISFLKQVLSHKINLNKDNFLSLVLFICKMHSSMALLITFSNDLLIFLNKEKTETNRKINDEQVLQYLKEYEDQLKKSNNFIQKNCYEHLLKFSNIATMSSSGTVKTCIQCLAIYNKDLIISCAESRPKNEGKIQAIEFAEKNIKTILMTDMSLFSYIQDIDCIIVGADAIGIDGVVNKIGTYPLAQLASIFNIPIYCISKTNKILPYDYKLKKEKEKPSKDILDKELSKIYVKNFYFDTTPLHLFNGIITEKGLLRTNTIKKMIKNKKLHPKLKEL